MKNTKKQKILERIEKDILIGQIELAGIIAEIAHEDQFREKGLEKGTKYILHPKRIASKFSDSILVSASLLHDVIEDTEITENDLREFGIDDIVIETVKALSKKDGENYLDFINRIKHNINAIQIKMEDIKDNLNGLDEGSLKDKYRLALYILQEVVRNTKNRSKYINEMD